MSIPPDNNLSRQASQERALGVKFVQEVTIAEVARAAGYDSLFIDLEHSQFSLARAADICLAANLAKVSPFVRVPHECGNGFVQRVLDGGAKGIVVPHVHNAEDVQRAVEMVKYPPTGIRSINPSLLMVNGRGVANGEARDILAAEDAVSFVMIETLEALENLDQIAAVPGLDVMLIGSMDITIELGILAAWDHPSYQGALQEVSRVASRHGKLWGISGLFSRPDIWTHAIQDLGARFIVGALDLGLLSRGAAANVTTLRSAELDGIKHSVR